MLASIGGSDCPFHPASSYGNVSKLARRGACSGRFARTTAPAAHSKVIERTIARFNIEDSLQRSAHRRHWRRARGGSESGDQLLDSKHQRERGDEHHPTGEFMEKTLRGLRPELVRG